MDRNRDGVVTAEEAAAARTLSGLSSSAASQLQAIFGQSAVFTNAITGQTGSITGKQSLTNIELEKVQTLQGQTVSLTELVKRSVAGSETLNEALLNQLSSGINVSGISSMVSGLNNIGTLIARVVSAQEAALAASQAELNRQQALVKAQAQLEATFTAQTRTVAEVNAASQAIFALAGRYGVYLNANAGPVDMSQSAKFGVNNQKLFESQYNQISAPSGADITGFKKAFYADGGTYSQTYGRAAELQNLAADLEARRRAIIDLGGVPSYAVGTDNHPGGPAYVHKDEMLNLPRGSSVSTKAQTRDMLSNDDLRKEVAELRKAMMEVVKNTKRSSDVIRGWDVIGQPPVRVV